MRPSSALLPLFALLVLSACRPPAPEEEPAAEPGSMAEAMNAANQAIQGMTGMPGAGTSRVVTPEELRGRMPETVAGLARVDLAVMNNGMPGMMMTTVQARYEGEGGREVAITMSDLTGVPGGTMAGAAWSMTEFDRTSATGYERTTRFEGLRAFEVENRTGDRTSVALNILAGNIVVQLTGEGVEMGVLHDAARQLNLPGLTG